MFSVCKRKYYSRERQGRVMQEAKSMLCANWVVQSTDLVSGIVA